MKTLAIYGIIAASAIGIGFGTGAIIKRECTEPERDYSGFDTTRYNVDEDALIAKVNGYGSKKTAFTSCTAVDLVNYSLATYKRFENSYSIGVGLGKTVISQQIRNAFIKNGDRYFEECVSKSDIVGVANRAIQTGINGDVDLYTAPENGPAIIIDTDVCGYYESPKHCTAQEYTEMYGRTPSGMFNYIVHKDSVESSEKNEIEGGYEFVLKMYPDIATYNYQFQMQTISHLKKKPTFTSAQMIVRTDENLVLKAITTDESYNAIMGFEAKIDSHIEYTYFANQYYKIPDLKENFDYVGLQNGVNKYETQH